MTDTSQPGFEEAAVPEHARPVHPDGQVDDPVDAPDDAPNDAPASSAPYGEGAGS